LQKTRNKDKAWNDQRVLDLLWNKKEIYVNLNENKIKNEIQEVVSENIDEIVSEKLIKHIYSSAPKYAKTYVLVKITADKVIPLDENYREIITHKRLYGKQKQESMKWLPYLTQLSRKPRALKYSGIYDLFPDTVKSIFDNNHNHSEILKSMSEISVKSSFEISLKVLETAIEHNKFDPDSLQAIHDRIVNINYELPEIKLPKNTPELAPTTIDLSSYDEKFLSGGDNLC